MTTNLLALSGLSALSFGGARMIAQTKMGMGDAPKAHLLADLVCNDKGDADLGDFQMILITLTAVLIFLGKTYQFPGGLALQPSVTLPDVDTALLSAFGLGQAAYLLKKGASRLGLG